ncbi:MAG: hypothetical protein IJ685_10015 [Selenomonadaceae bacterium]|nr:hypothetical protein [Selenomonadaceae bacterium]
MGKTVKGQARNSKRVPIQQKPTSKTVSRQPLPDTGERIIWSFSDVDRDGKFAFNPKEIDCQKLLEKLIDFSSMKWSELVPMDGGKSPHHRLSPQALSAEAKARIKAKGLEEESDAIFSFRLSNKERLIGIRNGVIFKAIWYDANHEFAPSHLRNT